MAETETSALLAAMADELEALSKADGRLTSSNPIVKAHAGQALKDARWLRATAVSLRLGTARPDAE